jgi:hypothetical protein
MALVFEPVYNLHNVLTTSLPMPVAFLVRFDGSPNKHHGRNYKVSKVPQGSREQVDPFLWA